MNSASCRLDVEQLLYSGDANYRSILDLNEQLDRAYRDHLTDELKPDSPFGVYGIILVGSTPVFRATIHLLYLEFLVSAQMLMRKLWEAALNACYISLDPEQRSKKYFHWGPGYTLRNLDHFDKLVEDAAKIGLDASKLRSSSDVVRIKNDVIRLAKQAQVEVPGIGGDSWSGEKNFKMLSECMKQDDAALLLGTGGRYLYSTAAHANSVSDRHQIYENERAASADPKLQRSLEGDKQRESYYAYMYSLLIMEKADSVLRLGCDEAIVQTKQQIIGAWLQFRES